MSFWIVVSILVLASIPWGIWPIKRAVPQEGIGYTLEVNVLGFFIPIRNLSDRHNRLERQQKEAADKAKKLKKDLEDEQKLLKEKVEVINNEYRAFLHDFNGKRHWRFLFRVVPVPSYTFVEPIVHERKRKNKYAGERETFTLEGSDLPPEVKATGRSVWYFRSPLNQQALDAQSKGMHGNNNRGKNKGGGNQNNHGNN